MGSDLVNMLQSVPLSVVDAAITIWLGSSLVSGFPLFSLRASHCNTEIICDFAEWLLQARAMKLPVIKAS